MPIIKAVDPQEKTRTYQCIGRNDHVPIDFALAHLGTVTLPAGIYDIADSLLLDEVHLIGEVDKLGNPATILKLTKGLPTWGGADIISKKKALLMGRGAAPANITLENLVIDGSQADYYSKIRLGTSCFNMATLININGLTIKNCLFKNGCNDALLLANSKNILIDKITVNKCGHDGVYAWHCDHITVKNSKFSNRTNSSCRFDGVSNGVFSNNQCNSAAEGFTGVEMQGNLKNILIYNNKFWSLPYPAIMSLPGCREDNVQILENEITNCKQGISVGAKCILSNNIIK